MIAIVFAVLQISTLIAATRKKPGNLAGLSTAEVLTLFRELRHNN